LALAAAGSNVAIVGRSEGNDVLQKMKSLSFNDQQRFTSHPTDLTTATNCRKLVEELKSTLPPFDIVVFTIGAWPDSKNLYTSEGKSRVVSLDIVARFVIMDHLIPFLPPNSRIMSVLASSHVHPSFPLQSVKDVIAGTHPPTLFDQFYCGMPMDSILLRASHLNPEIKFIGTDPGFVETDLLYATFPKSLVDVALDLGRRIGLVLTEEQSGWRHVSILAAKDLTPVSFYDEIPIGRRASPRADDEEFQSWLWNHLKSFSIID
jgi:NAD(P)-dependent dehydrogenase (short-subunit alcohol dehydrogenase family)